MSLADEIKAKRRKAAMIGCAAFALVFALFIVDYSSLSESARSLLGARKASPILDGFIFIFLYSSALAVGFIIYFRMTRVDKYVLWLRRFHRRQPERLRFAMLLNRCAPCLCIPITVQDTAFRSSYYSSGARFFLVLPIIISLGSVIWILSGTILLYSLNFFVIEPTIGKWIDVFLIAGSFVPPIWFAYAVSKYFIGRGYITLEPANAVQKVRATLRRMTHRTLGFNGVLIFKCPDQAWQEVVHLLVSEASAVIIDVSELTENVLWELRTSLQSRAAQSVLLAFGVTTGGREELPDHVRSELSKIIGGEHLSELHVFYYPAEQPQPGPSRGRLYYNLFHKLSAQLSACIETGPDVGTAT
jgi:hypothetical protein